MFWYRSQQIPNGVCFNRWRQQAELIQQAFRIAQSTLGSLGHDVDGFGLDGDGFLFGDPSQMLFQRIEGNPSKIEPLAAAKDGREHPLWIGGGKHEHHLWGWFFQRLEQGVEGCRGKHVAFIHHIHLPAGLNRCKARPLD